MLEDAPYNPKTMKLNTNEGFKEHFYSEFSTSSTYIEAYEKTEELHLKYFGRYRFASYDSFRHILRAKNNKRK